MVARGCMVARGVYGGYDEIWPMSGQYASYWNAFLFSLFVQSISKVCLSETGFFQSIAQVIISLDS